MMTEGSTRAYQLARQLQRNDWEPFVIGPPAVSGLDELKVKVKGRAKGAEAALNASGEDPFVRQEGEDDSGISALLEERFPFPVYHAGEPLSLKGASQAKAFRVIRGMPQNSFSAIKRGVGGLFSADASDNGWEESARSIAEQLLAEHPDIEIIYAQGPPVTPHMLGLELSGKYNKPLIFDCLEPYDIEGGESVSGMPVHQRLKKLEDQVLHSGQALIMPSRAMKVLFLKKHFGRLAYDDISIVENGYDPEEIEAISGFYQEGSVMRWTFILERLTRKEIAGFLGSIAALLKSQEGLRGALSFALIGSQRSDIDDLVRKSGLGDCVLLPWCYSRQAELDLCMMADVCGVVLGQNEMNECYVPERFYDAIGMKKTLFGVVPEGVVHQILSSVGGRVVPVKNIGETGDAILDLVSTWQAGQLQPSADDAVAGYKISESMKILIREIGYRLLPE